MNNIEIRPWGEFEILLDSPDCKVKRITVNPGQAPSYQYHFKRMEHWVIVSGTGTVKMQGYVYDLKPKDYVVVEQEAKHQIRNTGTEPLIFIETQLGSYFGEDDIVRLEDNYGRI
jgi:mannose-6-phosphate isomerase-like protein (cupin superfamily)